MGNWALEVCIVYSFCTLNTHRAIYFIGEHADGCVIDIESRNVVFLEEEFPTRGEMNNDSESFELRIHKMLLPIPQSC